MSILTFYLILSHNYEKYFCYEIAFSTQYVTLMAHSIMTFGISPIFFFLNED